MMELVTARGTGWIVIYIVYIYRFPVVNRLPLSDVGDTMPSLLYISIRRLASSLETCSTLSYDTEMNTIVIVSESDIYIEQMY